MDRSWHRSEVSLALREAVGSHGERLARELMALDYPTLLTRRWKRESVDAPASKGALNHIPESEDPWLRSHLAVKDADVSTPG